MAFKWLFSLIHDRITACVRGRRRRHRPSRPDHPPPPSTPSSAASFGFGTTDQPQPTSLTRGFYAHMPVYHAILTPLALDDDGITMEYEMMYLDPATTSSA
ncbi:MAG: hypothetical protein M1834_000531 [Cirrosporium novae-zelandiae]|nr:MAG: hypothetical protein M1834_000531 [Cirrosporium novae-zelandiae]